MFRSFLKSLLTEITEMTDMSVIGEVYRHESQEPAQGTQEYIDGELYEYDQRCGWCKVPSGYNSLSEFESRSSES